MTRPVFFKIFIYIGITLLIITIAFSDQIYLRMKLGQFCRTEGGTRVFVPVVVPATYWDGNGQFQWGCLYRPGYKSVAFNPPREMRPVSCGPYVLERHTEHQEIGKYFHKYTESITTTTGRIVYQSVSFISDPGWIMSGAQKLIGAGATSSCISGPADTEKLFLKAGIK